jgi:hypothetical protein
MTTKGALVAKLKRKRENRLRRKRVETEKLKQLVMHKDVSESV